MDPRIRAELLQDLRDYAASVDLAEIIRVHGSPLVIIDPASARARLDELQTEMPFVRFDYAVTALPHPALVQALWGRAGFALSNVTELALLEAAGVPADGAVLTHPVKTTADIERAYAAGLRRFVVDSPAEVDKLARLPKDLHVLVRIAAGTRASAYGIAPEAVVNLVRYALSIGVNVSGLSFHLHEEAGVVQAFDRAIRRSLDVIDEVERVLGVRLGTLDIGGGFPAPARHRSALLSELAAVVRGLLAGRVGTLAVSAEPGRSIADAATVQVSRVIGQTTRDGEVWNHIDDGVFGAFSRVLTDGRAPVVFGLSEVQGATERLYPCTLAGPSGSAHDIVAVRQLLPAVGVGDVIIARHAGAYSLATAFGGSGQAGTIVVADASTAHPALTAV